MDKKQRSTYNQNEQGDKSASDHPSINEIAGGKEDTEDDSPDDHTPSNISWTMHPKIHPAHDDAPTPQESNQIHDGQMHRILELPHPNEAVEISEEEEGKGDCINGVSTWPTKISVVQDFVGQMRSPDRWNRWSW